MDITGKTIAKVTRMEKPGYDDAGWLKLDFTDGSFCVIWAGYDDSSYTGNSEGEYPTRIGIDDTDTGLMPST